MTFELADRQGRFDDRDASWLAVRLIPRVEKKLRLFWQRGLRPRARC